MLDYETLNREEKRDFWRKHIQAWEQGTITQTDYCTRNNVNIKSFHYWKNRLKNPSSEKETQLTKISKQARPNKMPTQTGIEVIINETIKIRIDRNFDQDVLQEVVKTLGALQCS